MSNKVSLFLLAGYFLVTWKAEWDQPFTHTIEETSWLTSKKETEVKYHRMALQFYTCVKKIDEIEPALTKAREKEHWEPGTRFSIVEVKEIKR